MDIIGHGIDVIDIDTFDRLLGDCNGDFLIRCFTEAEIRSAGNLTNSTEHFAGKFAAKEAVAKALGTGFDGIVAPSDIEVMSSGRGKPTITLHGEAAKVAAQLHISTWCISISHSRTVAIASAIALRSESRAD
jgi:holo-[acyl-carrier protein] synthase